MPWMTGRGGVSDSREATVAVSFLLGFASASLIWAYSKKGRKDEDRNDHFIHRNASVQSHIGELPKSKSEGSGRSRWPWDKIRRTMSSWAVEEGEVPDESDSRGKLPPGFIHPSAALRESFVEEKKKTDLCIGSIFGLDVGGTLAKLVYFEQQDTALSQETTFRELHYHQAASAAAVLGARRGRSRSFSEELFQSTERRDERRASSYVSSTSLKSMMQHTPDSDNDLTRLYMVRQESVPDNLEKYAECCNIPKTHVNPNHSVRNAVVDENDDDDGFLVGKDHVQQHERPDLPATAPSSPQQQENAEGNTMRRARSMFDFSKSRDHAEALDRFYNFARRLDAYETGVKDKHLSFFSRELGGDFHFIRFETRRMDNAMDLIRVNNLHLNIMEMGATGGGAHKYAAAWQRVLGIEMVKQDELDSLVAGMQFVLSTVVGECYTFRPKFQRRLNKQKQGSTIGEEQTKDPSIGVNNNGNTEEEGGGDKSRIDEWWWSRKVQRDVVMGSDAYPYLLVTIGTGVSILRVDGPRKHERISGSTIGGGTYWGLMRLLTDVDDFEDVMKLAEKGDPSKVDMMVGDIYGPKSDALEKFGLSPDVVASSFGKLVAKQHPASGIKQEDLARALLLMVTVNIGQVAYLNAKLHNTARIYFLGNFLRNNQISQRRLSFAIDYWSKGIMEALFLEHEGYFGALGAFLLSQNISHGDQGFSQWDQSAVETDHDKADHHHPDPTNIPLPRQHRRSTSQM